MGDVVVLAVRRRDESCLPVLLRDGPPGRRVLHRGMTKIGEPCDGGLTMKSDKYMVVMGPSASRPPDGLRPNQAQGALPMV